MQSAPTELLLLSPSSHIQAERERTLNVISTLTILSDDAVCSAPYRLTKSVEDIERFVFNDRIWWVWDVRICDQISNLFVV